jgi:hypothetical protein
LVKKLRTVSCRADTADKCKEHKVLARYAFITYLPAMQGLVVIVMLIWAAWGSIQQYIEKDYKIRMNSQPDYSYQSGSFST